MAKGARAGSCIKLVLALVVALWLSSGCLFGCAVGFAIGGGFSPAVALVPAFAILLGVAHAVVGWAQGRWDDLLHFKRLHVSLAAALGFALGWGAVFVFGIATRATGSETSWLMWALPTLGCISGLGAVLAWSMISPRSREGTW